MFPTGTASGFGQPPEPGGHLVCHKRNEMTTTSD